MAEARRRGSDTPGILSVLMGIGFLVLLGFGLGVVAGLLVEEPSLVIDYASGDTETVELAGEGVDGPAVSAAPGADSAEPTEPLEDRIEEVAPPAPPRAQLRPAESAARQPPAANPAREGFAVQVGAFAESAAAQALADRVRASGFEVYVSPSPPNTGPYRWRVRVGPVASRSQAESLAERLKRERLPTWVLAEDAG